MQTVLIADDSMTSRLILRRCLEMIGFQGTKFLEAKDGKEAYESAEKDLPSLILADLNMPQWDGEQLIAKLKGNSKLASTPVVVVTSASNPIRKERLLGLGAYGVIAKPVSPATVREGLGGLMQHFTGG
jgi:two-component system, chemotaxis family, chemotaxis protein CheY